LQIGCSNTTDMDKEILIFLYQFYEQGNYVTHHSLNDIFNKLPTKWDNQNSINDVRNSINRLVERDFIAIDNRDFNGMGCE